MRAVFVANEDHGARNPGLGKYRGIVSGSARDRLVRQAKIPRGGAQLIDPSGIHGGRRRLQPAVELEFHAALVADRKAFRHEQIVERFERLLALASRLEAEFYAAG